MSEAPEDLKVALIGSHGVGKTSLLRPLSKALNVPELGELATDIAKAMGYEKITDLPESEVCAFQWNILHQQVARELKAGNYVSDRSTVCNAAYWTRLSYQAGKCTRGEHEAYLRVARAHAQEYTHLFYFPIAFALEDDGFRHTDPAEQLAIDDIVRGYLTDWNLWDKTYTVTSDGKVARIAELLQHLEDGFAIRRAAVGAEVFHAMRFQRQEVTAG